MWLFRDKKLSAMDSENYYLDTDALRSFTRICTGLFCSAMLIAPMAILLLVELSDAASLGVIAAFGGILITFLSLLSVGLDGIMLGFCAQVAVLATFLANVRQQSS